MEHAEAVELIRGGWERTTAPQHWVDLGCGTGTFTRALADLLPPGSTIEAVDRDRNALAELADQGAVHIRTHVADMRGPLPWQELDGILLANALHYVKEQPAFLHGLSADLRPRGCFLVVEYDGRRANPWVPYPVDPSTLERLFADRSITWLGERPSTFGSAMMYAALIR